jgi:hypothetical protein
MLMCLERGEDKDSLIFIFLAPSGLLCYTGGLKKSRYKLSFVTAYILNNSVNCL